MAVVAAAAAAVVVAAARVFAQVRLCDRGLAQPSSARHPATVCRCHDVTLGISQGFSRGVIGARTHGFCFDRARVRETPPTRHGRRDHALDGSATPSLSIACGVNWRKLVGPSRFFLKHAVNHAVLARDGSLQQVGAGTSARG